MVIFVNIPAKIGSYLNKSGGGGSYIVDHNSRGVHTINEDLILVESCCRSTPCHFSCFLYGVNFEMVLEVFV